MSLRALRKLRGDRGELDLPETGEQIDDDDEEEEDDSPSPKVKGSNRFDLLLGGSLSESEVKEDDDMIDAGDSEKQGGGGGGALQQGGGGGARRKQRKKKKKKGHARVAASSEDHMDNEIDDIDSIVREVNAISGEKITQEDKDKNIADRMIRTLLSVEHKHLNPQNEMKRIFGSRVVQAENNRRRGRGGRSGGRSTWIVQGQPHWLHYTRPGISMSVVESTPSCQIFKYEHSISYQQTQFKFLDAVESLNPENIMALLNQEPFHVDTLLQVSDIFRLGDDSAMAAQLLERALYVLESAAHPLFNITTGTCRLNYKQQENRSFFIALFRHILNVGRQGCYRTALELCKLLLSLSPDEDPLAVALMMDFYALKAQQYAWLVQFYHHYEPTKNLSMLPNFAYSIPLALYHLSIGSDTATPRDKREESKAAVMMKDLGSPAELRSQADSMLQEALIMFPGLLMPLLDKCSIQPDPQVATDTYLGPQAQTQQSKGLSQVVNLYVGRCYHTWKEADVVSWLEENVQIVLGRIRSGDSAVSEAESKRSTRYQGTPIPIYRHILIAEVTDATAALPQHLANSPVMSYDPLPPSDTVCSYTRPPSEDRPNAPITSSILTTFFRSLMPNYDPNAPEPQLGEGIEGGGAAEGGGELRASVNTLLDAMRDLLANIHLPEPQVNDADESEDENREWD